MNKKVRIALVGAGGMGRKYAQMLVEGQVQNMELTGVVARNDNAREWAAQLQQENLNVYADTQEMFESPDDYDAVLIVTPHKSHCEIAKRAFELGKHVLCDKPAAENIKDAADMKKWADEADLMYGLIFHQRLYPKYLKIKEILDNAELGSLKRIMLVNSRYFRTAYYHSSASWRSSWNGEGGGALINQGAHILDVWQWLFGMPKSLYAMIPYGKYNDFKVDDEVTLMMTYPDNLTAVFMLTTGEGVWEERLEIVGTKGKLLMENDTLTIWKFNEDLEEYMAVQQVNTRENLEIQEDKLEFVKVEEPYAKLFENFARAVITGDRSLLTADGEDALNQLMLTNGAYYSAWNRETVVLPLDVNRYQRAYEQACRDE